MAKRRRKARRNIFGNSLLNTLALAAVVLPVISFSFFVYGYASLDQRPAHYLNVIPKSDTPKLFEEPLVTVTFDDGWQSVYTNAAPLLEKYGIRSTQYVMPGAFLSANYLSIDQIRSLKTAGHEIASHTMTHLLLPHATGERLAYEVQTSKQELINQGLVEENIQFAPPESATNKASDEMVIDTYYSQRNTFGDIETGVDEYDVNLKSPSFNKYDIIGYSLSKNTTLEHLKAALNYTYHHDGWFVLVYHQVDSSDQHYSTTPEVFREHMKMIAASHIKTATIGEVLEAYEARQ